MVQLLYNMSIHCIANSFTGMRIEAPLRMMVQLHDRLNGCKLFQPELPGIPYGLYI